MENTNESEVGHRPLLCIGGPFDGEYRFVPDNYIHGDCFMAPLPKEYRASPNIPEWIEHGQDGSDDEAVMHFLHRGSISDCIEHGFRFRAAMREKH